MNRRADRVERMFDIPILLAAALVIPAILFEQTAKQPWHELAGVLDWTIWSAFALELTVMLVVVPDRRRWLRDHPLELAVVVLTPPFLPTGLSAIRVLRLLRLVRLLAFMRVIRRTFTIEGLRYAGLLTGLLVLGGGAAFSRVEHGVSTWDGVWWSVTTVTTVGYGDVTPHTDAGRAIAVAVMLAGIGFIALLTGAIAQRFVAQTVGPELASVELAEEELLREIQDLTQRLQRLEGVIRSMGATRQTTTVKV